VRARLVAIALLAAAPAGAQDLSNGWPYRRTGAAEGGAILGVGAGAAALMLFLNAPAEPNWNRSILFDDGARGLLRASEPEDRRLAGTLSNAAYLMAVYPIIVDAGLVTWLGRGQRDAAWQLVLIDAEAIAVEALLSTAIKRTVGRARPYVAGCSETPDEPGCSADPNTRNSSFLSGHSLIAFTAASTLCVQHSRLSLYGGADAAVCPAALAIATTTSLLRVVADRHWSSDVLAGALLGLAVGATVSLVHLHQESAPRAASGRAISYGVRL
jgi:membrane-associated phospholipid phosphatase